MDAGAVDRRAALRARGLEALALRLRIRRGVEEEGRRDHALARLEQRAHLAEVGATRHVQHAVGLAVEQCLRVLRGADSRRLRAAERARVDPVLLRREHAHAGELEARMREDAAQRLVPDVAGRPLDHPQSFPIVEHLDAPVRAARALGLRPGDGALRPSVRGM